jgi:ABC-type multidrug transport system fused ATPase/permease subunit
MFVKLKQKYFKHFIFFYSELGVKIYIGLLLSIIVGFLDGLGLAMFFPLLQMVGGKETADGKGMENLQFLTDLIQNAGFELTAHTVLGFIVILFLLKGLAKFIEGYYSVYVLNFFVVKLRQKSLKSFANYSFKSFIKADTGQIQNTLSNEVGRVAGAYKAYFMTIQNGVFVIIYLLLAFLSNSEFALFVIAAGVLSTVVFLGINKKTRKLSSAITHDGNHYQGLLIQMVAFYKYLKSTGRFVVYSNKLWKSILKIERSNIRIGRIQAFLVATREPLVVIMVVLVILLQITYFGQNIQVIFLSLLFFYRALNVLIVMQGQWISFLAVTGSMENMQSFLVELEINKEHFGTRAFNRFENELKFSNISFGYNTNDTILKNINHYN